VIQRKNPKLGLKSIPTLINDTSVNSEYFRVSNLPTELTSGKNYFKIIGNAALLKKDTEILVEVTDVNNDPIYHHVNKFIDETGRRVVSIYVYEDTPEGIATITILGIAKFRPNGSLVTPSWENKYNVKWSYTTIVAPERQNSTDIIFSDIPGVKIEEKVREFLSYSYETGSTNASSSGTEAAATLSYSNPGNGVAYIDIEGDTFNHDMMDIRISVPSPNYSLGSNKELQIGETLAFDTYVQDIISDTRVQVSPWQLDVVTTTNVATGRGQTPRYVSTPSVLTPSYFNSTTDWSMTYQQEGTFQSGSKNSQSFANIILKNIDPIAGDVYKVKTYMKSQGFDTYVLASEDNLEDVDLLSDPSLAKVYNSMGLFKTQDIVDKYWNITSSNYTPEIGYPKAIQSNNIVMSGVTISGSESITSKSSQFIEFKTDIPVTLYKDNEYTILLDISAVKTEGQQYASHIEIYASGSNIGGTEYGELLTSLESEITTKKITTKTMKVRGKNARFKKTKKSSSRKSSRGGKNIKTIPAIFEQNTITTIKQNPGIVEKEFLTLTFVPAQDTNFNLVFNIYHGEWTISNVTVKSSSQTGFTPNHTFIEFPVPTYQADDVLDFKFEFVNVNGASANVVLTRYGVDFAGSNTVITGLDNILEGTLFVGDGMILEGIQVQ
tara:strand:- start:4435 stop:6429 length:1995 start_codon:yes stop_codon:yes gene_type:complete